MAVHKNKKKPEKSPDCAGDFFYFVKKVFFFIIDKIYYSNFLMTKVYWFKRKTFWFWWTPIRWEWWACLLIWGSGLFIGLLFVEENFIFTVLEVLISTFLLVYITYIKSDGHIQIWEIRKKVIPKPKKKTKK